MTEEGKITVAVKWQGKQFSVSVPEDADVACLKRCIEAETNVQPKRQKLLNVKSGPKPADDDVLLSSVKLPKVVMMMGSTEQSIDTVAQACGFGTHQRMDRAFMRQLGVTPSDYRARFTSPLKEEA